MQEEYVKEKNIVDKSKEEMNKILVQSIINTNNAIQMAQKNYEFAEGDLIDYYLYSIKANQSKLNYLIKTSKMNGIELSRIEKIKLMNLEENQVVWFNYHKNDTSLILLKGDRWLNWILIILLYI